MSKQFEASNGYVFERSESGWVTCTGGLTESTFSPERADALREFFEWEASHKPWDDAEDGEIWVLTVDGAESPYESRCGYWFKQRKTRATPSDKITAGRRIWPENAS